MSVLQKLTEGIVGRNLQREGAALVDKWERTGLLEGLDSDHRKQGMSRLLENQAAQLLKEASSMSAGDVEGFASVAFPIVRRVFGGLIANELVSVQPMSLPSGLIFFLDFRYNADMVHVGASSDESIYGGGVVGSQLTGGVSLSGSNAEKSFYALNNGYASPTGSADVGPLTETLASTAISSLTDAQKKLIRHDADILSDNGNVAQYTLALPSNFNTNNLSALDIATTGSDRVVRRLTSLDGSTLTLTIQNPAGAVLGGNTAPPGITGSFALVDKFEAGGAIGSVVGNAPWALEGSGGDAADDNAGGNETIKEIDIKVDSIAVTAITKKLKAKWTPELGQDLNAYHNLDAEVELTQVLSEQIALEIDRELLSELVNGATASTMYWSRRPGRFLDRSSGSQVGGDLANESMMGADFTGTVSEWYETLIETINDVSAQIHRKTLRGGANFVVCSPELANILEFTAGFRANVTHDADRGDIGAVKVGSLSRKFDVYVDPYFLRNVILVGRKGGSFLESGFVYAPYVPLQVTPTIFGTEDFVPRKGVMTRYAKKMVRPDMYGLVVVSDLNG
jgi:hypothetical protein